MIDTASDTLTPPVEGGDAAQRPMTPHAAIARLVMLVNPLSGGTGPHALEEARVILADYPCESELVEFEPGRITAQIEEALASKPDLVIVLAGDGTAQAVASRAGANGPLVAPLPGGTMNMLPKAIYGTTDWKAALRTTLETGTVQAVSGGVVEGQAFYCAAILGSPALWAPAREAVRHGKLPLAFAYARRALKRAFSGRLRYGLDGASARRAEALVLISPMISKVLDEPVGLEAAAMDPGNPAAAFRLGAHALFDDWRSDPSVSARPAKRIEVTARSRIPAVIDGEPTLLPHRVMVRFTPKAFRTLAPDLSADEATEAAV